MMRASIEGYVRRQCALFGNRVMDGIEDVPLPNDQFFDTCFHLVGPAGERRTKTIAERLKSYLESGSRLSDAPLPAAQHLDRAQVVSDVSFPRSR